MRYICTVQWVRRSCCAVELILSAPVFGRGASYYRRGVVGIKNRSPNMYTLIGLGVLMAYLYSLAATFAPAVFPPEMRDQYGMVGVYFEVAAAIITLVLLGEWLERHCHPRHGCGRRDRATSRQSGVRDCPRLRMIASR